MREYYGVYRRQDGKVWAWKEASHPDDIVALQKMKVMTLKSVISVDGELKEKVYYYDLDLLKIGNRVVFNG